MAPGATFDTGLLVALERRRQTAWAVYRRLHERDVAITVPAAVVGEWWRGRTDIREALLASVHVESFTESIARLAGEALAVVKGAATIDAFVMASAALRGDVVYTSDVVDLERLRSFFPAVRVLAV
jgi:predicted nucleic acid-binding protein